MKVKIYQKIKNKTRFLILVSDKQVVGCIVSPENHLFPRDIKEGELDGLKLSGERNGKSYTLDLPSLFLNESVKVVAEQANMGIKGLGWGFISMLYKCRYLD